MSRLLAFDRTSADIVQIIFNQSGDMRGVHGFGGSIHYLVLGPACVVRMVRGGQGHREQEGQQIQHLNRIIVIIMIKYGYKRNRQTGRDEKGDIKTKGYS